MALHWQIMYGIDGRHELPEETLDTWRAIAARVRCASATPPRRSCKLDIYGELMDAVYLYDKYGTPIAYDVWTHLRRMLDWVRRQLDAPRRRIWEVRADSRTLSIRKCNAGSHWIGRLRLGHQAQPEHRFSLAWPRCATRSTKRS